MSQSRYDIIDAYHEATKHHFHRYARSAGYMDWANQPTPFRRYENAVQIELPLCSREPDAAFTDLFVASQQPGQVICLDAIAAFFEFSLALSAWKQSGGSRWPLRINPSSGNLHPTECYLVVPALPGLAGGIYHYNPLVHALEQRAALDDTVWLALNDHFGASGFLVALSTIFWRESWKYGERAFRYCQLDTGHALAALIFAARLNDWHLTLLGGVADSQIERLLGFDRTPWHPNEDEVAELMCWVSAQPIDDGAARAVASEHFRQFADITFLGDPSPLSPKAVAWPIINQAASASEKGPIHDTAQPLADQRLIFAESDITAASVIRGRRSAVRFDPNRSIDSGTLKEILGRTIACRHMPPFNGATVLQQVEAVVFIHRVRGLSPGIYLLKRQMGAIENLKAAWHADFLWRPVAGRLPLWQLIERDVSGLAATLSCHQDIAGHSAFAVAMIAPYEHLLRQGTHNYRRLHWECGVIGQVLYLAAEAHGLRGTGIGCFFDDEVHRLLGIQDKSYQVLYHFTVGHPIEDDRLSTLPAYQHINPSRR
ncbi:MAG: SagB/ThcOx family dehydrogenase [Desulfobacteraceae bacterium]|jgi:SagB-type dehydrogenase family enzyme